MKKRFGDRYDGEKLRKMDPIYKIIPYIMKTRDDAQVFFDNKIYIDKTMSYLSDLRQDQNLKIGFLHIVIAAMVRTISQRPRINRFISGKKLYARNEILVSLAVKKDMNETTPETTIKLKFKPTDTLFEIIDKVNNAIDSNKDVQNENETDKLAKLIMLCPGWIVKSLIGILNFLDHRGWMPKVINRASPFHTSVFVTDLGSLGIEPVYHHIYNFGTTSLFVAFGLKNSERVIDKNHQIVEKRYINMKVVVDERICDGYYYAKTFRLFKRILENPKQLEIPPIEVYKDDEL